MLRLQGVSMDYRRGTVHALRDVSLECGHGILGLLGPNGAGKSTLLRIIATLAAPTSGVVRWTGIEVQPAPDRLRAVLGYLPQDFGVYPNLTAVEFLEYIAAVKGLDRPTSRDRTDELLTALNLRAIRGRPLGGLSGGTRQRVGIAQALLNDPRLLVLDEPTAGLDPEERVRFRAMLVELARERVVVLSTHVVSDVEFIADRIAILAHGRLLAHQAPLELRRSVRGTLAEGPVPTLEEAYLHIIGAGDAARVA